LAGAPPRPRWGAYSAPPDLLAGFNGPTSKGREGRGGKGPTYKGRREGRGKGRGSGPQLLRFPGSRGARIVTVHKRDCSLLYFKTG